MPQPDNWYDTIKDFQTGIGTVVGLLGVGVSLYMNFRVTNQKRRDDMAADRIGSRAALLSEMLVISEFIEKSKVVFEALAGKSQTAFPQSFNAEASSRAYRAALPKIGLLTEPEIRDTVLAYSAFEMLSILSNEHKGDAQSKLTASEKAVAFNAYLKQLKTAHTAATDAIGALRSAAAAENEQQYCGPQWWVDLRKLFGF